MQIVDSIMNNMKKKISGSQTELMIKAYIPNEQTMNNVTDKSNHCKSNQ